MWPMCAGVFLFILYIYILYVFGIVSTIFADLCLHIYLHDPVCI